MSISYIENRAAVLGKGDHEQKKKWKALLDRIVNNAGKLNTKNLGFLTHKLAYFDLDSHLSELITRKLGLNLFKDSLFAFRELYSIQHPANTQKSYDHLISMVGLSLEPVMHTILTLCPKSITLCMTDQSKEIGNSITTIKFIKHAIKMFRTETSYNPDIEELIVDHSNTAEIFAKVNGKMHGWLKGSKNIALDITGGKKSMDVTAFLAATMYEGIDIYYVDFEGYEHGNPIYGTEFLSKLVNPYHFFSIREKQLIHELWHRKNYAEVERQLNVLLADDKFSKTIADNYGLQEERDNLANILKAAACYDLWRNYDYKTALGSRFDNFNDFHSNALDELSQCQEVYGSDAITFDRNTAFLALKIAIDRYARGSDAVGCHEWNRAALSYTQAIEALLRYSYAHDTNGSPNCISRNKGASLLVQHLFNKKYDNDCVITRSESIVEPFFNDESLFDKIHKNVLYKRNDLSHFECIVSSLSDEDGNAGKTIVPDYFSAMTEMEETVKRFFQLFAAKYDINPCDIEHFNKLVTYCTLDEHLRLRHPAIPS